MDAPSGTGEPADAHRAGRLARQPRRVRDAAGRRTDDRGVEAPRRDRPRPRGQGRLRRLPDAVRPPGVAGQGHRAQVRGGSGGAGRVPVPAHVHHRPRAGEAVPAADGSCCPDGRNVGPGDAARDGAHPHHGHAGSLDPPSQLPPGRLRDVCSCRTSAARHSRSRSSPSTSRTTSSSSRRRSSFMERDHNDAIANNARSAHSTRTTACRPSTAELPLNGQKARLRRQRPARRHLAASPMALTFDVTSARARQRSPGRAAVPARPRRSRRRRAGDERSGGRGQRRRARLPGRLPQARLRRQRRRKSSSSSPTRQAELRGPGRPLGRVRHAKHRRQGAVSRITGPIGGDIGKPSSGRRGRLRPGAVLRRRQRQAVRRSSRCRTSCASRLRPGKLPSSSTQTLDSRPTLKENARRLRNAAVELEAQAGAGAHGHDAEGGPLDVRADSRDARGRSDPGDPAGHRRRPRRHRRRSQRSSTRSTSAGRRVLPRARAGTAPRGRPPDPGPARRRGAVAAAAHRSTSSPAAKLLPEVVTARLDWSARSRGVARQAEPGRQCRSSGRCGAECNRQATLAVEIQAPTRPGKPPTALVSCSISPFDLQLIAPASS